MKTYKLPERELAAIRDLGMSYDDARNSQEGYFSSWIERLRTERDGHPVITLQERGQGWAVEVTPIAVSCARASPRPARTSSQPSTR